MTPLFPPFGNAAIGAPPGATLGSGGKTEGALGLMEPSGCERAFTSSMIRANTAGSQVGAPSSVRAWMWTIAAPAS